MKKRTATEVSEKLGVPTSVDERRWSALLSAFDYKPGWGFEMRSYKNRGALAVRFRALVWDTIENRDLKPTVITTDYQIPGSLLGAAFTYSAALDWLRKCIHAIETHEADEWIRFDGMQCYNPHGHSQKLGRRPEGWEWIGPPEINIAPTLEPRASFTEHFVPEDDEDLTITTKETSAP